jgi:serine protease Do
MFYNYDDDNERDRALGASGNPPENPVAPESGPVTDWRTSVADLIGKTADAAPAPTAEPELTSTVTHVTHVAQTEPGARTEIWSDPSFREYDKRGGDGVFSPGLSGSYRTSPYRSQSEPFEPTPVRREVPRRRHGFLRAVCLALVCVLLSGAASYGVLEYRIQNGDIALPAPQVVLGAQTTATNPEQSPALPLVSSGDVLTAKEIYKLAKGQVVAVSTVIPSQGFGSPGGSVYGSGFVISADGYIMTNYHVIEAASQYGYDIDITLYDGTTYKAKVVGYEADNDVAVVKVDAVGLNAVKIGSSSAMEVGATIYAVGNPRRLDYTMTDGIVSALDRTVQVDQYTSINMFQISAAVNSGNSGGPVYSDTGDVLGIVSAKYASSGTEGLGFAIPIDDAMAIASELISNGYITGKARLGVEVQTMDANTASYFKTVEGAYVTFIYSGSCAEKAGIKPGDIITKLGETDVTSTETLKTAKRDFKAGDTTTIVVNRGGEVLELTITLDEEPGNAD